MSEKRKRKLEKISRNREREKRQNKKRRDSIIKTTEQLSPELLLEIFAFEGAEPLSSELVDKLIHSGWQPLFFDKLREVLPRCECGCGFIVFYNERRDSILSPSTLDDSAVFEFLKDGTIHLHTLPPEFKGAFSNAHSQNYVTLH